MASRECKDHKGRGFASFESMCREWGIDPSTIRGRLRTGWTLAAALTTPSGEGPNRRPVIDHLGRRFRGVRHMAKEWKISYYTLLDRLRKGWDIKRALTEPLKKRRLPSVSPDGERYSTFSEMCMDYGIKPSTVMGRMHKKGLGVGEALLRPIRPTIRAADHLGRVFPSFDHMCKHWKVKPKTVRNRLARGWDLRKALTRPVKAMKQRRSGIVDPKGKFFPSIAEMCREWDAPLTRVRCRLARGWSVDRALKGEAREFPYKSKPATDHLGKTFESTALMCAKWGIDSRTYMSRLSRGWTQEKALTEPVSGKFGRRKKTVYA